MDKQDKKQPVWDEGLLLLVIVSLIAILICLTIFQAGHPREATASSFVEDFIEYDISSP